MVREGMEKILLGTPPLGCTLTPPAQLFRHTDLWEMWNLEMQCLGLVGQSWVGAELPVLDHS